MVTLQVKNLKCPIYSLMWSSKTKTKQWGRWCHLQPLAEIPRVKGPCSSTVQTPLCFGWAAGLVLHLELRWNPWLVALDAVESVRNCDIADILPPLVSFLSESDFPQIAGGVLTLTGILVWRGIPRSDLCCPLHMLFLPQNIPIKPFPVPPPSVHLSALEHILWAYFPACPRPGRPFFFRSSKPLVVSHHVLNTIGYLITWCCKHLSTWISLPFCCKPLSSGPVLFISSPFHSWSSDNNEKYRHHIEQRDLGRSTY